MNNLNFVQKSVLATIAYYDIFDHPLTGLEAFKYLINPLHIVGQLNQMHETKLEPMASISFAGVLKTLENFRAEKVIAEKNGFYFLPAREAIIKERIERQKISGQRWKKVKKVIKLIQFVPFLEMVAVCNSLAIDNSKEEADIDFFIVAKKGRIWSVRLMVTFLIWIMGEWRHKEKISARICLSFYVSDNFLNLRPLAINPYDIYLAHWIAQLRPVFCQKNIYAEFISQNFWVRDYLLNFGQFPNFYHPEFKASKIATWFRGVCEGVLSSWLGNLKEKILCFFQKKKISRKLVEHDIPTAVVVSENVLKFHENDKRAFFQQEFLKRIKNTFKH